MSNKQLPIISVLTLAAMLAACGGGGQNDPSDPGDAGNDPGSGGSGSDNPVTYRVGGTVAGLAGSGLVISNNAADELTLDAAGTFFFAGELPDGTGYDVAVVAQPAAPEGVCTVGNGSGTISAADVTDIEILCTGPLALLEASPQEDDQNASRAVEPLISFSSVVEFASVAADTVTLASSAGEVDLSFAVSGGEVTLSPANILLPLTEYTLTVTTDVVGSAGERLLEPASVTFKTRDAMWQADIAINAPSGDANGAQVAFDGQGNALALWQRGAGDRGEIWWNYFTTGVGWGTAEVLEQNGAGVYAGNPRFGFDAAGNALAVWSLIDNAGSDAGVRSSRYNPGSGWSAPEFIEAAAGEVLGDTRFAMNDDGEAIAAWLQFDGTFVNVWANRYAAGGGWGTAEIVDETDDVPDPPQVAIGDDGEVLVVWAMRDSGNFIRDIWGRRRSATGWDTSTLISTNNNFSAVSPRVVRDDDGNALAIWMQDLGLQVAIYTARYTAGAGWGTPDELSASDAVEGPQLTAGPDGSAMAVWEQRENVNGRFEMVAHAARFTAASGWDVPEPVSNRTAFYPKIAIDASGHAVAAWYELDDALPLADAWSVWSNRYTNGSGWTAAEKIGSNGGLIGTDMPNIAVDPSGDAFAIWTRGSDVRVNRFE